MWEVVVTLLLLAACYLVPLFLSRATTREILGRREEN